MDNQFAAFFETHPVATHEISHTVHLGPIRGPGVLLLHEVAGLTTNTFHLATEITEAGFTVAVPHLFGRVAGEGIGALVLGAAGLVGRCINREMSCLVMNQPERGTRWLEKAATWLAEKSPSPQGVGVIGMCATGSYALGAIFHPSVGAVIASQAAMPALRAGSWGVRGGNRRLQTTATPMMALRFRRDWHSAKRRVKRLPKILDQTVAIQRKGPDDPTLPACARGIEVQTGDRLRVVWVDGSGHSALNFDRVNLAVDEVIGFLQANLGPHQPPGSDSEASR